jgi:pimeloyl-ACP methyl ester carboxylesterase/DNA-binding CsgD family transcriptional regulator
MTHLLLDWESSVWRHWLDDIGARFTYIRYDERGCGLSSNHPAEVTVDAWLGDLHGVIESSGFDQVALMGMSHAAALAVAYAARHPERVSHIISLGGYAAGGSAEGRPERQVEDSRVFADAMRVFWEAPDLFFQRAWSFSLIPGGSSQDVAGLEELMRRSSTGEVAAQIFAVRDRMDVRDLAQTVETPTLVAHARRDHVVLFDNALELAALLPNASLLALDTENHLLLREPAWERFLREVMRFIDVVSAGPVGASTPLTDRERSVLGLVAEGLSNDAIAAQLALSTRTVERHLTNVYRKLGVFGRNARAAAAARFRDL